MVIEYICVDLQTKQTICVESIVGSGFVVTVHV